MIHVIASIHIREGKRSEYLEILKKTALLVRNEEGCIEYIPAGDIETGLPAQQKDGNVVTILERWESLDALNVHLRSAHMQEYRERVQFFVDSVSIKVLEEV